MSKLIAKVESRWTKVGDLLMHSRVSVNPPIGLPTVVLVHGLGVSSRYMVPLVEQMAAYAHVYAPDLPGFGKSQKPADALNIAESADVLAAWMQAIKLGRSVLLGNSFGCQVVVALALRHPELISRAVLVAPTIDGRAPTVIQQLMRLLWDAFREPLSLVPLAVCDYLKTGFRRGLQTLRYAIQDPMRDKLPQVRVPTLVVGGGRDPLVPQRWVEEVARLLPQKRLVMIPGAAHAINYNAPQELAQIVRMFMCESWVISADETEREIHKVKYSGVRSQETE